MLLFKRFAMLFVIEITMGAKITQKIRVAITPKTISFRLLIFKIFLNVRVCHQKVTPSRQLEWVLIEGVEHRREVALTRVR